jgi:hypothetical protein
MSKSKYLKGECQHCAGHLEFLADHIGMVVPCPHCEQTTELLLPQPPEESAVPRRAIIWTMIAVMVLGLGLAGALLALKRAQRLAETQKQHAAKIAVVDPPAVLQPIIQEETNSTAQDGLSASAISLQKAPGTSLVYAVGTLKNSSNRQRFGIKIEFELTDTSGAKVGVARDYRQVLEPGSEWQFKALVVDSKATRATLTSIKEDQ